MAETLLVGAGDTLSVQIIKDHLKIICLHIFTPEGNFDIDAVDGGGWGVGVGEPLRNKIPKTSSNVAKQNRTEIVHTSRICSKNVQKYL